MQRGLLFFFNEAALGVDCDRHFKFG